MAPGLFIVLVGIEAQAPPSVFLGIDLGIGTDRGKELRFIAQLAESVWRAFRASRQFYPDFASGWRGLQSFGGKATRQNDGLGNMNSTPT
jgi:hypothetical protein